MKPLALRSGQTTTTPSTSRSLPVSTPATAKTPTTTPSPPPDLKTPSLPPTAVVVAKQAGQGDVPAWATPGYFQHLGNGGDAASPLKGGRGLQVRLQAMTTPNSPPFGWGIKPHDSSPKAMKSVEPPKTSAADGTSTSTSTSTETRQRGLGLLQRAMHGAGVIGGRPLTAAEIAEAPVALHLTKPEAVASILENGLRPTTGLYKNLTTWFRNAVYMFGREPTAAQKFVNFSTAASQATATIEIDLQKLDPARLYKRVLDGAIIYVSDAPIPKDALRVRSGP